MYSFFESIDAFFRGSSKIDLLLEFLTLLLLGALLWFVTRFLMHIMAKSFTGLVCLKRFDSCYNWLYGLISLCLALSCFEMVRAWSPEWLCRSPQQSLQDNMRGELLKIQSTLPAYLSRKSMHSDVEEDRFKAFFADGNSPNIYVQELQKHLEQLLQQRSSNYKLGTLATPQRLQDKAELSCSHEEAVCWIFEEPTNHHILYYSMQSIVEKDKNSVQNVSLAVSALLFILALVFSVKYSRDVDKKHTASIHRKFERNS